MSPHRIRSCRLTLEVNQSFSSLPDTNHRFLNRYEAGDHLAVLPSNDQVLVNRIGQLLDVDLDEIISLVNTDGKYILLSNILTSLPFVAEEAQKRTPFPCPCSYRTALTHYLDITGLPSVQLLKDLTQYATDDSERALLTQMSSFAPEGKVRKSSPVPAIANTSYSVSQIAYQQWIRESARSVIAILEDLPSLKPPLDHLCELLPRLQPRYYSISSSPKVHPTSVHITAGIVQYQTSTQRTVNGVATHGFRQAHLQQNADPATPPSHRFPIYIRKSTFRLPANTETPVIMIGSYSMSLDSSSFHLFIQVPVRAWHPFVDLSKNVTNARVKVERSVKLFCISAVDIVRRIISTKTN